nr:hypothetical protein CFP56_15739 [Quercus suber]
MGRTSSGAAVVGLDKGELVVVEIRAGWESVGGGGSRLGIGLEEVGVEECKGVRVCGELEDELTKIGVDEVEGT